VASPYLTYNHQINATLVLHHTTEAHENAIEGIITCDNIDRTRKLSMILFLVNFVFVFLFIDYINRAKGLWIINDAYQEVFYAHVILGSVTLFYFLISYRVIAQSAKGITFSHKFYVILFGLFILSLSAVFSGWITQRIHGQSTVYVMACFTIAVMFNYKPKVAALLYGFSCLVFLISLTKQIRSFISGRFEKWWS